MKEGDASAQDFFGELRILRNEPQVAGAFSTTAPANILIDLQEGLRSEVLRWKPVIKLLVGNGTVDYRKPIFPRGMVQEPAHPYEGSSVHAL
jgi:hypothetical protein